MRDLAFSPDGARLAAAGDAKRLDVWHVADGRSAFDRPVYVGGAGISVRWQPDSRTLVFGGDDGRAVQIDVDHGAVRGLPLPAYPDNGGGATYVAPMPDGRLGLLPGPREGHAPREGRIYSLTPADWLTFACDLVRRDLTATEWADYLPEPPYRRTCTEPR